MYEFTVLAYSREITHSQLVLMEELIEACHKLFEARLPLWDHMYLLKVISYGELQSAYKKEKLMAIVSDVGGNGGGITGAGPENKLSSVNRGAATVIDNLVPSYIGEIAHDVASDQNYVAKRVDGDMDADTLTNADWVRTTRG